jgi:hypothetical protein
MPSPQHELILMLFRNRSTLLACSIKPSRRLKVPSYTNSRIDSTDLTDMQPAEYRADLVVTLVAENGSPAMSVIVEAQLARDDRKRFVWPAYAANLRARLKCPVCVLVVTLNESVARWAAQPIELGGASRFVSLVLGPRQIAQVTDIEEACAMPELAVLSVMAHGQKASVKKAVRIARAALLACADLEDDQAELYADVVYASLSDEARQEVLAMKTRKYEFQSDFARRYVALGRAEGKAEGRAEIVRRQLTLRFGALSRGAEDHISQASSDELDGIAARILTAETLEQVLNG